MYTGFEPPYINKNILRIMRKLENNDIYLPEKKDLPVNTEIVSLWYKNLLTEISTAGYSNLDLALLTDKQNYYGKFFSKKSRNFFLHHFADNLVHTINYLFAQNDKKIKFLEIGCGCGNQLLLSSLLGAEAAGCDIRKDVCELISKRKEFYEKISNSKLEIISLHGDVFKVNWEKFGKFDAILMLFSFNYIKPNHEALSLVSNLLNPGGRLVIQDRNVANYYNRIIRKRKAMLPKEVASVLRSLNFKIDSLRGGYAIPPIFWRFLPNNLLQPIEKLLNKSLFLSVSYRLMAEKL